MRTRLPTRLVLLLATLLAACAPDDGDIRVAPPTGEADTDRASILAALEEALPGSVLQFAPGRYRTGGRIAVEAPGITLVGHPDGTVLESCDASDLDDFPQAALDCDALEVTGGDQTIRGLTFESAWHGVVVGCCQPRSMAEAGAFTVGDAPAPGPGGVTIRDNVFRGLSTAVRVHTVEDSTVIRDNVFEDVGHAISINGSNVHFRDNLVLVNDPGRIPVYGGPLNAVGLNPGRPEGCARNVVARNRIEGHPLGIGLWVTARGTTCRGNVLEGNTIVTAPVRYRVPPPDLVFGESRDSSLVDVPILVMDELPPPDDDEPARITGTRIEENHVVGGVGLAIELRGASRSRIAGNAIQDIRSRDPFPGTRDRELAWGRANGAAIWVAWDSHGNEITDNVLDGVVGPAVFLEGDDNVIRVLVGEDVADRGEDNRVERTGEGGG